MKRNSSGFAIIYVIGLIALASLIMTGYLENTMMELRTSKVFNANIKGFYSAESGLSARTEVLYGILKAGKHPTGTAPTAINPCFGTNLGTGQLGCIQGEYNGQLVYSYIKIENNVAPSSVAPSLNERSVPGSYYTTIQAGQPLQLAPVYEKRYTVVAFSYNTYENDRVTKDVTLEANIFRRDLPLAALDVYKNGNLVLNSSVPLRVMNAYNFFADGDIYLDGTPSTGGRELSYDRGNIRSVSLFKSLIIPIDPGALSFNYTGKAYRGHPSGTRQPNLNIRGTAFYQSAGGNVELTDAKLTTDYPALKSLFVKTSKPFYKPSFTEAAMGPGNYYWDKADVRIVLKLTAANALDTSRSTSGIEVRNQDNTFNTTATTRLNACLGRLTGSKVVLYTNSFRNQRENANIRMLDVDFKHLQFCIYDTDMFTTTGYTATWYNPITTTAGMNIGLPRGANFNTAVTSDDGLIFYFGVDGPNSAGINTYGVRLNNAQGIGHYRISKNIGGVAAATQETGFPVTIVTNQAVYLKGGFATGMEISNNCIAPVNASFTCPATPGAGTYAALRPVQLIADTVNLLSGVQNDANSALAIASRVAGYETTQLQPYATSFNVHTNTAFPIGYRTQFPSYIAGSIIANARDETAATGFLVPDFFRLHENWSAVRLNISASIAILGTPVHTNTTLATQSASLMDLATPVLDPNTTGNQNIPTFQALVDWNTVSGFSYTVSGGGSRLAPAPMFMTYLSKSTIQQRAGQ